MTTEAVAMGRAIEPLERDAARERQLSELKQNRSVKFTERLSSSNGEALNKVADAVGMSRPTYTKAKERQGERTDLQHSGNFPQSSVNNGTNGRTRDKVGAKIAGAPRYTKDSQPTSHQTHFKLLFRRFDRQRYQTIKWVKTTGL